MESILLYTLKTKLYLPYYHHDIHQYNVKIIKGLQHPVWNIWLLVPIKLLLLYSHTERLKC
jgi:hypothetical protein